MVHAINLVIEHDKTGTVTASEITAFIADEKNSLTYSADPHVIASHQLGNVRLTQRGAIICEHSHIAGLVTRCAETLQSDFQNVDADDDHCAAQSTHDGFKRFYESEFAAIGHDVDFHDADYYADRTIGFEVFRQLRPQSASTFSEFVAMRDSPMVINKVGPQMNLLEQHIENDAKGFFDFDLYDAIAQSSNFENFDDVVYTGKQVLANPDDVSDIAQLNIWSKKIDAGLFTSIGRASSNLHEYYCVLEDDDFEVIGEWTTFHATFERIYGDSMPFYEFRYYAERYYAFDVKLAAAALEQPELFRYFDTALFDRSPDSDIVKLERIMPAADFAKLTSQS